MSAIVVRFVLLGGLVAMDWFFSSLLELEQWEFIWQIQRQQENVQELLLECSKIARERAERAYQFSQGAVWPGRLGLIALIIAVILLVRR